MATWLSLTNDVLRRLREPAVSSVTENFYSALIGHLVNRAKVTVEDAWSWRALRTVGSISTSSGVAKYTVANTNERTYVWARNRILYDMTNRRRIYPAPPEYIAAQRRLTVPSPGDPVYYQPYVSGGLFAIELFPTPASSIVIELDLYVPQNDLAANDEVLKAPTEPVLQKAWALALEERGETGGSTYVTALRDYSLALANALMRERALLSHDIPRLEIV